MAYTSMRMCMCTMNTGYGLLDRGVGCFDGGTLIEPKGYRAQMRSMRLEARGRESQGAMQIPPPKRHWRTGDPTSSQTNQIAPL